jgi:hypothetical protein
MMGIFGRRHREVIVPEDVSSSISRLERITDQLTATAAALENLVATMRREQEETSSE